MATITQNQQRTDSEMQDIRNQMTQMATTINRLESQTQGKLPSQPELNPKNVSAMTLRSGKEIQGPDPVTAKDKDEERIEKELKEEGRDTKNSKVISDPIIAVRTNPPPFPSRLEKSKKQDKEKEVLEIFRKVEINIPLLDAIKQGDERVVVGKNVSAILQRKLPPKCGDAGPLKDTGIIIQLADRTNAYPDGLIEDVLVKINELVFPADFYVLDMDDEHSHDPSPLLLDKPFLSTARTKIDVNKGNLSMEFDGDVVHFNIFETMKYPLESHAGSVFSINAIDPTVREVFEIEGRDELEVALTRHFESEMASGVELSEELKCVIGSLQTLPTTKIRYGLAPIFTPESHQRLLPSVLELKPLPKHLKYAYLGEGETLPVIISTSLSKV
nr:uncharacterized protein LOC113696805 [Coffea arabica]